MIADLRRREFFQHANRGRGGKHPVNLVFLDNFPPDPAVRVRRQSFVNNSRHACQQRRVNDIGVADDPADIRCAKEYAARLAAKNGVHRGCQRHRITADVALDAFRFAGSAGGVKNARSFIGFQPRHRHSRAEMLLAQRGKIQIAPIHPRHFRQPSVHQQNVFRLMLRLRNSVIKQLFIRQDFTAPRSGIRRHNQRRSGIVNARRHAVRGKTAKDHRMDRANARAGQQGYLRFGNHRHIDQYAIATLHAQRQQHGGHSVDFIMQLAEGKCALFIGL